ncbi:MAG: archaellin/type IV pilin N-terminal domain-containing protein [Nanopusillaceae archaeon]
MKMRSVSPLIATIILIALTVALGAIIVGWARGYVKGQVSTLGANAQVLGVVCNKNLVNVTIQNIGSTQINLQYLSVEITTQTGSTYKCPISLNTSTVPQGVACIIYAAFNVSGSSISSISNPNTNLQLNDIIVLSVNTSSSLSGQLTGSTVGLLYYDNQIASSTIGNC